MNPNFPCKECGHIYEVHVECFIPCACGGGCDGNDSWCEGKNKDSRDCDCFLFEPDNLAYLDYLDTIKEKRGLEK